MARLQRGGYGCVYIVDSESAAQIMSMEVNSGGSIQTAGALTVNIYGCNDVDPKGLTFVQLYDEDGTAAVVTATAAGIWAMPSCIFNALFVKLVGTQTTVKLCVKS
jgi:hypothetical protein